MLPIRRSPSLACIGILILATAGFGAGVPTPRLLQAEDFAALRWVRDPNLSPDGAWVVYTVKTTDLAKDKTAVNLWLAAWDGRAERPLTFGANKQNHPRWSPDGRWIAFLSDRGEDSAQLWRLPRDGGEAEKLTDLTEGIEDFAWSPDSTKVVLTVRDPDPNAPDPKAKEKKTVPPIVIDRFEFKHDIDGYLTDFHVHLQLLDLGTRKVERLTSGASDDLFPTWAPDGRTIAFVSKRAAEPDRTVDWSILLIEPRSGAKERSLIVVSESEGFADAGAPLAWSPDSQSLAFLRGGDPKLIEYAANSVAVIPAQGGVPRPLAPGLDRNLDTLRWSADGQTVLALLEDDGTQVLAGLPITGGAPKIITPGRLTVNGYDAGRDGRFVILVGTPERLAEIFAVSPAGRRPLSHQNDELFSQLKLGQVEETVFKSTDGTEVHGFLTHPAVAPPTGVRPAALLRPHGGPQEQYEALFSFEAQLFAAQGYTVILPNPRGSTGRGTAYSAAIYADWGHRDVEDDLAAVDDAIARGVADPDRLGVGGWSYGGMSTNYLIATTTRFKAATSGASIADMLAGYGTDQYVRDYEYELGPPWSHPEVWQRISFPFLHADRIKTPTLFLAGDKDFNVPLHNSEQMYQALRSLGVPSQLVIYPGQFHGLTMPSYILDRYHRYLDWYARWLPAAKPAAP